jgi:hypothetical protein
LILETINNQMTLALRKSPKITIGAMAITLLLLVGTSEAQDTPATASTTASPVPAVAAAPASSRATASNGQQPFPQTTFNQNRLFGVLPNYSTVESAEQLKPLTVKEKYLLSWDAMTDKVTFPFIGFQALIGQAENSEPSYGQGFEGYAKRYATSYADAAIATTMTTSVFPSLLHQDPRYYVLGTGGFAHRTLYAVKCIFATRSDYGRLQFNTSEIAGNAVAAGLSNLYHPAQDRTFSNTMSIWGTDVMWDAVSNVAKEFWPDIRRHFKHEPKN